MARKPLLSGPLWRIAFVAAFLTLLAAWVVALVLLVLAVAGGG